MGTLTTANFAWPYPDSAGSTRIWEHYAAAFPAIDTTVKAIKTTADAAMPSANFLFARKTSDQTLASNTTFQNDTALSLAVAANAVYRFELYTLVRASNATNGGLKVQFTGPSGFDMSDATFSISGSTAITNANGSVTGLSLTTTNAYFGENGLLVTSSTPGTFQFQWAQSGTSVNNTIVAAGSFFSARRVA